MAPHLAVGTMRNDKMGEPCFYLMGQNQTTVCSQVCPSSPSPLKSFLSILSTPSAHPHLNSTLCICPWVCLLLVCMLPVLSCLNRRFAQLWCAPGINNSDWSKLCCCFSNLSMLPAAKHTSYFLFLFFFCFVVSNPCPNTRHCVAPAVAFDIALYQPDGGNVSQMHCCVFKLWTRHQHHLLYACCLQWYMFASIWKRAGWYGLNERENQISSKLNLKIDHWFLYTDGTDGSKRNISQPRHICHNQSLPEVTTFFCCFFYRRQWRAPSHTRDTKHSGSENTATQQQISHLIGVQLSTRPSQIIIPGGLCTWPRQGWEGQGWVRSDGLSRPAIQPPLSPHLE